MCEYRVYQCEFELPLISLALRECMSHLGLNTSKQILQIPLLLRLLKGFISNGGLAFGNFRIL